MKHCWHTGAVRVVKVQFFEGGDCGLVNKSSATPLFLCA